MHLDTPHFHVLNMHRNDTSSMVFVLGKGSVWTYHESDGHNIMWQRKYVAMTFATHSWKQPTIDRGNMHAYAWMCRDQPHRYFLHRPMKMFPR